MGVATYAWGGARAWGCLPANTGVATVGVLQSLRRRWWRQAVHRCAVVVVHHEVLPRRVVQVYNMLVVGVPLLDTIYDAWARDLIVEITVV